MKWNPAAPRPTDSKALLARFCQIVREYRQTWGLPPDREVVLSAWAQARKEIK
jgi:predicted transcriptional regulator